MTRLFFTALLLFAGSLSFADTISLAEIQGKWIYLTIVDGERVRFEPCDADNKGFEIRTENSKTYLFLLGGLDVSAYIISGTSIEGNRLLMRTQMEGSNDLQSFEFWWEDKSKGIGHLAMKDESQKEMYDFEYVHTNYENQFATIKQPCVECLGTECTDLTKKDQAILDQMKKITGSWISVDAPYYSVKFVNAPNFATGIRYDYYQKKEQARFNYSFYNGDLSIYEPASGAGETYTIIELTTTSLILSGPLGKRLIFKRPIQTTGDITLQIAVFLRNYFKRDMPAMGADVRKYAYATADINQDGKKEIFIALVSSSFCGSGGCTMLILDQNFKLLSKMTVVDFPIYITRQTTNGWSDLIIESGGYRLIRHNGKSYPSNPSVQPHTKLEKYPVKSEILKDVYTNTLTF